MKIHGRGTPQVDVWIAQDEAGTGTWVMFTTRVIAPRMAFDDASTWREDQHPRNKGKFAKKGSAGNSANSSSTKSKGVAKGTQETPKGSGGSSSKPLDWKKVPKEHTHHSELGKVVEFFKKLYNNPKARAKFLDWSADPTKKYMIKNALADLATFAIHVPGIPGSHLWSSPLVPRMLMQYYGDPKKAWKSALFDPKGKWFNSLTAPVPHGGALRKRIEKSGKSFIDFHRPKIERALKGGFKAIGRGVENRFGPSAIERQPRGARI